jgi:hypothetical protein
MTNIPVRHIDSRTTVSGSIETDIIQPIMVAGNASIESDMFGSQVVRTSSTHPMQGGQLMSTQQILADAATTVSKSASDLVNEIEKEREKNVKGGKNKESYYKQQKAKKVAALPSHVQEFLDESFNTQKIAISKTEDTLFLQQLVDVDVKCSAVAKRRLEEIEAKVPA